MKQFTGKVALVTGASVGIGREAAIALAREGAAVVVADVLEAEGAATVRDIQANDGKAVFVRTDVSKEADLKACVRAAVDQFGRLDIAVNNAGIEQSGRSIVDITPDEITRIFGVNVNGVLLGMKHQIPAIHKSGGGAIVNLSSIAGLLGFPGASVYVASKHAVIGLTRTAALECASKGIRVNAVCPGAIQTAMIDRFVQHDAKAKDGLIAQHPLGRIGQPAEIAAAIVWLCSKGASFVTGQYLTVDGGYTTQ